MCAVITALDSRAHAHTPWPAQAAGQRALHSSGQGNKATPRQEQVLGPAAAGGQAVRLLEAGGTRETG